MRSNTPVLADLAHPGTAEASKTSWTLNTMTNLRNGATWSGEKEPTRRLNRNTTWMIGGHHVLVVAAMKSSIAITSRMCFSAEGEQPRFQESLAGTRKN